MARTRTLFAAFVLTALALATAPAAHGWDRIPVKVDGTFIFKVNVKVGNKFMTKPAAPWYTYFPYDPHTHGQGGGYPMWPQPWPPAAPRDPSKTTKDGLDKMNLSVQLGKAAPAPTPMSTPLLQPNYSAYQPVSYYYTPAYWYGR